MSIIQLLDELPPSIVQPSGRLWNVLARSLGEQGADGRTALAWRWALTGTCPSPITLSPVPGWPPDSGEIVAEAAAPAELSHPGNDRGGQVMHARLVLEWLVGARDTLPLWNAGPGWPHVTDGVEHPRAPSEVEELLFWAGMACRRYTWPDDPDDGETGRACGWAYGTEQLLTWACGEAADGPLTGLRTAGRPTLYGISRDVQVAMTGVLQERRADRNVVAGRMEGMMETFLWLTGWNSLPPVDRHGHATLEVCPRRQSPCCCAAADRCLLTDCLACAQDPCIYGFNIFDVDA